MPRQQRFFRLNFCHHVMLRGVNGHDLFLDNSDRSRFCLLLQAAGEQHSFQIHAFCLMKNHVHLILEPNGSPLQKGVHAFSFRYAQYFNRRYNRRGYLFQGRFRSIFVEDGEYLKRLVRYIHRNPVESCLVQKAEDYPWSSHRAYMDLEDYVWLAKDFILSRFGILEKDAICNFREFIDHNKQAQVDAEEIFKAHRRGAYGSMEFIRGVVPEMIVNKTKEASITLEIALIKACEKFQVTKEELMSESKGARVVDARSFLAYLGRISGSFSIRAVAKTLGKNEGTISRLASRAEQRNDLKEFANLIL